MPAVALLAGLLAANLVVSGLVLIILLGSLGAWLLRSIRTGPAVKPSSILPLTHSHSQKLQPSLPHHTQHSICRTGSTVGLAVSVAPGQSGLKILL